LSSWVIRGIGKGKREEEEQGKGRRSYLKKKPVMSNETVGSLLAVIANSLNDALRILLFADKRAWGDDEFEQLHLLEDTLDEAKKDFQELPLLVNGRFYYENDRNSTCCI